MNHSFSCHCAQDERQRFLQDILLQKGYHAVAAELASEQELACNEVLSCKKIILLPVPVSEVMLKKMIPFFSKKHIILGGNLPKNFVSYCNEHEIACLDYMKIPEIAIENAVATAEGAIFHAIQISKYTLHQSKCLVIGFGKCGEILADRLYGFKADVTVSTRDGRHKSKARSYGYDVPEVIPYETFAFLFNTAPAKVITPSVIDRLSPDTIIIDIASHPGGVDYNYCIKKDIEARHCPGLPGKLSPKTSAEIIYKNICDLLQNMTR